MYYLINKGINEMGSNTRNAFFRLKEREKIIILLGIDLRSCHSLGFRLQETPVCGVWILFLDLLWHDVNTQNWRFCR
jgi:hypothetical protein